MLLRLKIAELARTRLGVPMIALAERLNVEPQTVLYWNQGRCYPRLPMMLKLCKVFNCELSDLVDH